MNTEELASELMNKYQWNLDDVRVVTEFVVTLHRNERLHIDSIFTTLTYVTHLINEVKQADEETVASEERERNRYQEKLISMRNRDIIGQADAGGEFGYNKLL